MRLDKRWLYLAWMLGILFFAALHAMHLRADFPNHSPWLFDWAKYTDEGWYGNAAVRAHLFQNWYIPGDFNPAPAVPVWPFLEWILFYFTGVTIEAARGLAIAFFFLNLLLSYLLMRARGPQWMALLAVTLLVTSPFLFCFSRLAILEPLLTALTLAALNLAVRLASFRRPVLASVAIGLLFTLMMLTKATGVFLVPALAWAMLAPQWRQRGPALRCAAGAAATSAISFAAWIAIVARLGLLADYKFLFFVNKYPKPHQLSWPLISLWWSFHGGLWVDHILIPLAGLITLGAGAVWWRTRPHRPIAEKDGPRSARQSFLLTDPVFGASVLSVAAYILFMTLQDHPQPRYFAVVIFFCAFVIAQGADALLSAGLALRREPGNGHFLASTAGWAVLGVSAVAIGLNSAQTLNYATHPEYTFVDAARRLTDYIDQHPNGNRVLLCVSGDQITLVTHLPTLNDLFTTPSPEIQDLAGKIGYYRPGWYASWNVLDPGMLEDIHSHDSVEQVARFRAFDDPTRNVLVLFKLHPWPNGQVYDPADQNLRIRFPEDKFDVPLR